MTNPIQQKNDDNGIEPSEPDHEKPIGDGAISDLIYISNGGQNEGPLNSELLTSGEE